MDLASLGDTAKIDKKVRETLQEGEDDINDVAVN